MKSHSLRMALGSTFSSVRMKSSLKISSHQGFVRFLPRSSVGAAIGAAATTATAEGGGGGGGGGAGGAASTWRTDTGGGAGGAVTITGGTGATAAAGVA